jgi:hypothetical protein
VPHPDSGRALIDVTGSSTYLQLVSDTGLICIKPLLPVVAAGIVDCDGGTNLGIVVRQDHRVGTVGDDGFTAESCAAAGGFVEPAGFPHPQVCNGPLMVEPSANADTGPGAVAIAPVPVFLTNGGLPAELTFEVGPQCTGQGDGFSAVFALISSDAHAEILHANNGDTPLAYDNPGENFSCAEWTQEDGPGKLILSFPTLHGVQPSGADLINVLLFDD